MHLVSSSQSVTPLVPSCDESNRSQTQDVLTVNRIWNLDARTWQRRVLVAAEATQTARHVRVISFDREVG